jgi:hypothetical protein
LKRFGVGFPFAIKSFDHFGEIFFLFFDKLAKGEKKPLSVTRI